MAAPPDLYSGKVFLAYTKAFPLIVRHHCAIFNKLLSFFRWPIGLYEGESIHENLSHMFVMPNLGVVAHTHAVTSVNITLLTYYSFWNAHYFSTIKIEQYLYLHDDIEAFRHTVDFLG